MVEIKKEKFSQLINEPKLISLEETLAIKSVVKNYPYFHVARVIELIGLKKHNSIRFNKALKKCSIFSTDRENLRDIIELNKINCNESDYIKTENKVLLLEKTKNSFIDWLKVLNPNSKEIKSENKTIIQNFLKSEHVLYVNSKSSNNNLANEFKLNKKEYMTETLAGLYLEQKKFKEAIKAYEVLCLKYPEKISLFADQIKKIKNSLKNQ